MNAKHRYLLLERICKKKKSFQGKKKKLGPRNQFKKEKEAPFFGVKKKKA